MYAPTARCAPAAIHKPITMGSNSLRPSECARASAIRLTRRAPSKTARGGIVALSIPSKEQRISERGEAAPARAIPCLRFFLTPRARPFFAGDSGAGSAIVLLSIRKFLQVEKRQFLRLDVALLREADGRRSLADQPLVGQVLACRGDAFHVEVPLDIIFDLAAGAGLADLA